MKLMRARDVTATSSDCVFRVSRFRGILAVMILSIGAVALIASGVRHKALVPEVLSAFPLLMLLAMQRSVRARFRPSNWLVRATTSGLYVNFRSYLNYHFSIDDLTVVFIPYREIAAAGIVRETVMKPKVGRRIDAPGRPSSFERRLRDVAELQLNSETLPLADALFAERARQAPRERRAYGSISIRAEHNPVMLEGDRLRIVWEECAPGASVFLGTLPPSVKIEESAARTVDYKELQELDRPALERRIGELARAGQMDRALLLTRVTFAYNNQQAQEFVDRLKASIPPDTAA